MFQHGTNLVPYPSRVKKGASAMPGGNPVALDKLYTHKLHNSIATGIFDSPSDFVWFVIRQGQQYERQ
jgi:hypothetical protein